MKKIIPSIEPKFSQKLDKRLLDAEPNLALETARISAQHEFIALLQHVNYILGDLKNGKKADLISLQSALNKTQNYVDLIDLGKDKDVKWKQVLSLMHILDHAHRLRERCAKEEYRAKIVQQFPDLHKVHRATINNNIKIITALNSKKFSKARKYAENYEKKISKFMKHYRNMTVEEMVKDEIDLPSGTSKLEAARWLVRVNHHIARISYYMEQVVLETAK